MPTALNLNVEQKKEIFDVICRFSEIAKKDKWVSHYDSENDSMVMRIPKLSADAKKRYILDDEFAFYITKDNKIQGIFIEYFLSNFVSHHADLRSVSKELKKETNREDGLVTVSKKEVDKITPELQEVLLNMLAKETQFQQA